MGEHVIKLPDVGEGIAEAELVEWHVKVGDVVREDTILAAVMTDKATVEIPSPVDGRVEWLGAEIGDAVAVGSELVRLEVAAGDEDAPPAEARATAETSADADADADARADTATETEHGDAEAMSEGDAGRQAGERPEPSAAGDRGTTAAAARRPVRGVGTALPRPEGEKPLASPSVRLRAREAGVDLRRIAGTGPAGRISHDDLDAAFADAANIGRPRALQPDTSVEEVRVVGLRRRIAERMAEANAQIPHITYVEECDVTALEELRARLNDSRRDGQPRLTILPFLIRAIVRAVDDHPEVNATYDDEAGVVHVHGGVHIGIATQTDSGLMVPVVRHAEARDIWECAAELNRVAEAARAGTAPRDLLAGSTITVTSLGALGGIVTTPIINRPEVAIVGVNRIVMRPHWDGAGFVPRRMMNLSSSFDHRIVDGWNAAVFVQRLKSLLETPAMIFVDGA